VFAFSSSYAFLLIARSLQGIGSSCSSVAGRHEDISGWEHSWALVWTGGRWGGWKEGVGDGGRFLQTVLTLPVGFYFTSYFS